MNDRSGSNSGRSEMSDGDGAMQRAQDRTDGPAEGAMGQAKAAGAAAVDQAQDLAHDLAPMAREKAYTAAESGREGAASAFESAADKLDDRVAHSDGMPAKAAGRAAEGMHAAAGYLEQHDTTEIVDDVEQYVRAHPVRSLSAAVAAGFIVGRILR